MTYRNRGYTYGDYAGYEDERSNWDAGRAEGRRGREDYSEYSGGSGSGREPEYNVEYGGGFARYGTRTDERSGRDYYGSDRAASRESFYGQGPLRSHLRCRDIMTRNVTSCHRDTPIMEIARLMRDQDIGAMPVLGADGKIEGIVTDRDLVIEGLTTDKSDADIRAEDCMTTDLFTANQNDRLVDMIREMGDHQVRRVPVVDGRDRLVGIISMADIATQTNKDRELTEALEDISQPPSFFGRLARLFNW
jgi:CBS domain-containing protein